MSRASAPGHLLSLAAGTEDGAALASFPHSFSPLPFHLPLPGPPTSSWLSDPEVRPFLVARFPSPSPFGAPPRTSDEYSAFLIASSYLRSQGAGCLIYIYIDLYVAPTSVQESGRKRDSRGGREPEVDDLRNQRHFWTSSLLF